MNNELQGDLAQETLRQSHEYLREGHLLNAPRRGAHFSMPFHRYLRGYPTLHGL